MKTNCIVEKQFLFWKYRTVEHHYKLYEVSKFMNSSTTFITTHICEVCGAKDVHHFVDVDNLILKGVSVDDLNKISEFKPYYPHKAV